MLTHSILLYSALTGLVCETALGSFYRYPGLTTQGSPSPRLCLQWTPMGGARLIMLQSLLTAATKKVKCLGLEVSLILAVRTEFCHVTELQGRTSAAGWHGRPLKGLLYSALITQHWKRKPLYGHHTRVNWQSLRGSHCFDNMWHISNRHFWCLKP